MRKICATLGFAALVGIGACGDGGDDDEKTGDPLFPPDFPTEPGVATWTAVIAGAQARAVGIDAAGNIYTAGTYAEKVDFGAGEESTRGLEDVYVARYGTDGALDWSVTMGSAHNDVVRGLPTSQYGEPRLGFFVFAAGGILTGACEASPAAGGNPQAIYLTRLSPDTGECLWVREMQFSFGEGAMPEAGLYDGVFDADGNLIVVGALYGWMSLGGKEVDTGGAYVSFVAKLNGDGDALWIKTFGSTPPTGEGLKIYAVDVDGAGNIYFAGSLIGESPELATAAEGQAQSALFAKLDPAGNVAWADTEAGIDHARAVVAGKDGAVAVAGMHRETGDVIVKHYDASGASTWSRPFAGTATLHAEGIAMTTDGHVTVAVGADPVTFGEQHAFTVGTDPGATSYSLDDNGMLLAGLDLPAGAERWSLFYGGSSAGQTFAIPRAMKAVPGGNGHLVLVGQGGNLDLGTGTMTGLSSFVARVPQ